jgi:lysophospholipase L1-like esterase
MKDRIKIVIVGNSVGLSVRPPPVSRKEKNYASLLREMLESNRPTCQFEVINYAGWSQVITDAISNFEYTVLQPNPDFVVIHFGINESVPRIIPRWLWTFTNWKYENPSRLRFHIARVINKVVKIASPRLLSMISHRGWISAELFGEKLDLYLRYIGKETMSKSIVLNVGPPSSRIESALPGSSRNVARCNDAIKSVVGKHTPESVLLDAHSMISDSGIENLQPDGIHLNAVGHERIASKLCALILKNSSK